MKDMFLHIEDPYKIQRLAGKYARKISWTLLRRDNKKFEAFIGIISGKIPRRVSSYKLKKRNIYIKKEFHKVNWENVVDYQEDQDSLERFLAKGLVMISYKRSYDKILSDIYTETVGLLKKESMSDFISIVKGITNIFEPSYDLNAVDKKKNA
jgi:hypothetical protein